MIRRKYEGKYWDFKKQWPSKGDLLHDIICMANNLYDGQSYLIIGVDESQDYEIVDVINDENRKNQQMVINFLKDKPFVRGVRPEVQVRTLYFENKAIDILIIIIMPSDNVPFYLETQFEKMLSCHIYTRVGDTNTPINRSADINIIEKLWRRRFGIDRPIIERLAIALDDFENWERKPFSLEDRPSYNESYPEFHIEYSKEEYKDELVDFCAGFYCNPEAYVSTLTIYYHSTELYQTPFWHLDECRVDLPKAKLQCFDISKGIYYYYYDKSSIAGKPVKLLGKGEWILDSGRKAFPPMLLFKEEKDRSNFEEYVKNNMKVYDDIILKDMAKEAIEYAEGKELNPSVCKSICKMMKMYLKWKMIQLIIKWAIEYLKSNKFSANSANVADPNLTML